MSSLPEISYPELVNLLLCFGNGLEGEGPPKLKVMTPEAVRQGCCVAIPDGSGGYAVVAERRRASAGADLREACRWIRRELSAGCGVAPTAVVIVSPGSVPRMPSGRLRRRRLGVLRRRGELPVEAELRFAARP